MDVCDSGYCASFCSRVKNRSVRRMKHLTDINNCRTMDGTINPAFKGPVVPLGLNDRAERSVIPAERTGRQDAWNTVKIYLGVFGCLIESVVLAGSIFGWASMVYVLEADGIYSNLCDDTTMASNATQGRTGEASMATVGMRSLQCSDQKLRLSLAFTLGILSFGVGIFPMGIFFDRFGLRISRIVCMMMGLTSYLLIGFTSQEYQWLYLVGVCLLGPSCSTLIMIHANVARLAGPNSGTLNGFFSGLLNTAFAFQAVKMVHDIGFDRRYSMVILSAVWVLGIPLSWLLPYHKISLDQRIKDLRVQQDEDKRTLKMCVFSPTYVLFLLWFSVIHVCWQMHTSSYNKWITYITHGNTTKISYYTDFQAWLLAGSLICAPLAGVIIDRTRSKLSSTSISHQTPAAVAPSVLVASTIALTMKVVSLWEYETVIYISVILFTVGKAFTYTSAIALLSNAFPTMHFGILFGIGYGTAGLAGLTCYVYLIWASESSMGFIPSNILILCTVVASYSCPVWCIYNYIRWHRDKLNTVLHVTKL